MSAYVSSFLLWKVVVGLYMTPQLERRLVLKIDFFILSYCCLMVRQ